MAPSRLSQRAHELRPSPTLAITGRARALKAAGVDVVSFAAGEPDFNTPEPICDAAIAAIRAGDTKYAPSSGTVALKDAIIRKMARDSQLEVKPNQVVVSCGAKHSIYNACMTLFEPGDEVLLIAPYWMTYFDQVRLTGATPVEIMATAENQFVPTDEQLAAAITPRTRGIILNSPSNPTGAVLPPSTMATVARLAQEHDLWIIADEIYERLTYGVKHASILDQQGIQDRVIYINGCSKTYAMTGWRIGYAVAPAEVAQAMSNLQDQVTSNPTSFAMAGAVVALDLPNDAVEAMRAEFEARRSLIVDGLNSIEGVKCNLPSGAFYAFPDISAHLGGKLKTDIELADFLLDEAHVAVVPGSVFKGPGHIRLTYAASRSQIVEGVSRIGEALKKI